MKIMKEFHYQSKQHYQKNVIESDASTTQSYLEDDNDEDKPTLGDVFGDKFKDLKF